MEEIAPGGTASAGMGLIDAPGSSGSSSGGGGVGLAAGSSGDRVFITEPALRAGSVAGEEAPAEEDGLDALKGTVAGTTEETQATLLLRKRKDMRMVEDALDAVKKEFKERMMKLSDRQLRFEEKQRALQEMVSKFKPFIEEVRREGEWGGLEARAPPRLGDGSVQNDAKRTRAQAKEAAEKAARGRLEGDVERALGELRAARDDKDAIEQHMMRLKRVSAWASATPLHAAATQPPPTPAPSFAAVRSLHGGCGVCCSARPGRRCGGI